MEKDLIKLISDLNSNEYYEGREEQNIFNYTTDGIYWTINYGNIKVADNIDKSYETIDEVKLDIKKFMLKLASELESDSKLLD